jgi:hypothetical protein
MYPAEGVIDRPSEMFQTDINPDLCPSLNTWRPSILTIEALGSIEMLYLSVVLNGAPEDSK